MPKALTISKIKEAAHNFAIQESAHPEPSLYGVTDGKAVGAYLEHKSQASLHINYSYAKGSSAKGIDLHELKIDIKVTSIRQPQSSCPFNSARQKIYGLGYNLLIFVYGKTDDEAARKGRLNILHKIFVDHSLTADFQTTSGLVQIIGNDGNLDDVLAFFEERMLPLDEIQANTLGEEVLANPPKIGYLTISNALQWRLQYSRVIQQAGSISGIEPL